MRDAVDLINQTISIKELNYNIEKIYFIPNTNRLYIGLKKSDGVMVNFSYNDLLPYLIKQIKL